ncbi:unnamed protein product [Cuscuta campestris]|uniref:Reverse transcriptase domain-containing protein n=1 Tax=Cuscuta campestris TaxID=132261 RepID=A0A484N140_9ASTE|nr:unnamed protein product [Cuscuta campestris]
MTVGCPTGADVKTPVFGPSEGMAGMAEAIFGPNGVTIVAVAAVGPITEVTGADPIVALDPTNVVIRVDPTAALDPKGKLIRVVCPTEPPNPAERSLNYAISSGFIAPFKAGKSQVVSHLAFADDLLVFLKGDLRNMLRFNHILHNYLRASGQEINIKKSKVDNATLNFSRPKAARVCIEIDVSKNLHIHLKHIDDDLFFQVLYEDPPSFCDSCQRLGHNATTCKGAYQPEIPVGNLPPVGTIQPCKDKGKHIEKEWTTVQRKNRRQHKSNGEWVPKPTFTKDPPPDFLHHKGSRMPDLEAISDFSDCIKDNNLLECNYTGSAYTWHGVRSNGNEAETDATKAEQLFEADPSTDNKILYNQKLAELQEAHRREYAFWKQKCNLKWLKDGDANTKFFHSLPTEEEIKVTIWDMDPNSSPGPDGFNINFFNQCWDIIKGDLTSACQEVFLGIPLPKAASSSNICLLPKTYNAMKLNDFRPVCLSTVASKIASKCIANRLGKLLHLIISEEQGAYVPGREIMDKILITKELVHHINRKAHGGNLIVKLDMAKAFDKLKWSYLMDILKAFGFSPQFIRMVNTLLTSSKYSILINGKPCGYFGQSRGIKQGDPLSPLLFIIANEGFSRNLNKLFLDGFIDRYNLGRKFIPITHLSYADDIIIFSSGHSRSVSNLKRFLHDYQLVSGQAINYTKSSFMMGSKPNSLAISNLKRLLGMSHKRYPFTYLGIPIDLGITRHIYCTNLISSFDSKLNGWYQKNMDQAGRLVLINHVLNTLPNYFLATNTLPKSIKHLLDHKMAKFLWGGNPSKHHWISWQKLCTPKDEGGLGTGDFNSLEKAFSLKLWWKYHHDNGLWAKLMRAKYWRDGEMKDNITDSPVYKRIFNIDESAIDTCSVSDDGMMHWKLDPNGSFTFNVDIEDSKMAKEVDAVEAKPLRKLFSPMSTNPPSCIVLPATTATHFELKPQEMQRKINRGRVFTTRTNTPLVPEIFAEPYPHGFKVPFVKGYDGESDPHEHINSYVHVMIAVDASDALMCRCFLQTVDSKVADWVNHIPDGSIRTWDELGLRFLEHFAGNCRPKKHFTHLAPVRQKHGESLKNFLVRWRKESREVEGTDDKSRLTMFTTALQDGLLHTDLTTHPPDTFEEAMVRAGRYVTLEERKEKKKEKTPKEKEKQGLMTYPTYSQKVCNVEDTGKWCAYHCKNDHNTEDCYTLKNEMAMLIRRGHLKKFVQDAYGGNPGNAQNGKRREGQVAQAEAREKRHIGLEDEEEVQNPHHTDRRGTMGVITSSVGTLVGIRPQVGKSGLVRQWSIRWRPLPNRKVRSLKLSRLYFLMLICQTQGVPHRDALVITIDIMDLVIHKTLVDTGSFVNIMYMDTYKALGLTRHELLPIKTPLTGFTGGSIEPEGVITLSVEVGDTKATRKLDMEFVVVGIVSNTNLILGRPGLEDLECVISPRHLCIKFSTPRGIGVARGSQRVSRAWYLKATKQPIRYDTQVGEVTAQLLRAKERRPRVEVAGDIEEVELEPGIPGRLDAKPVKQKRRHPSQERRDFVKKEVTTLQIIGHIREYNVEFRPHPSIKGQTLANFQDECTAREMTRARVEDEWWVMSIDGSSRSRSCGAAEYEALINGLKILGKLRVSRVQVYSDSRLVVGQISGERMKKYRDLSLEMLGKFEYKLEHIPRAYNAEADVLSKLSAESPEYISKLATVDELATPSLRSEQTKSGHRAELLRGTKG